jgi:tetratricopeptide (TPR) repeat protein
LLSAPLKRGYSKALALKPGIVEILNDRGAAYDALARYDLALVDYSKAIEISPGFAVAYVNRSAIYYHQHDYARAILDATKAIELQPHLAGGYVNCGVARWEEGDKVGATEDMKKALVVQPGYKLSQDKLDQYQEVISGQAASGKPEGKPQTKVPSKGENG